jgi:hypothetical protein
MAMAITVSMDRDVGNPEGSDMRVFKMRFQSRKTCVQYEPGQLYNE